MHKNMLLNIHRMLLYYSHVSYVVHCFARLFFHCTAHIKSLKQKNKKPQLMFYAKWL